MSRDPQLRRFYLPPPENRKKAARLFFFDEANVSYFIESKAVNTRSIPPVKTSGNTLRISLGRRLI